jgi:four helix bundle protein
MRDHRSLLAWQEAHAVSLGVIGLSRSAWRPYASALFYQLQRASLSTELNIAEGYTFGDTANFTRHLGIAYGSSVESAELLRLGIEAQVLPGQPASALLSRAGRASRLILGLLKPRRRFS